MSLKFIGSNRVCGTRKSDNSEYDFFNIYFLESERPSGKGEKFMGQGIGGFIRAYSCTPDVHEKITSDFINKEVMISSNGNRVFDICLK